MIRKLLIILALIFANERGYSQTHTKIADKHFEKEEFVEAAAEYKKVIIEKGTSSYAFKQLARTYLKLRNFKSASYYMGKYIHGAKPNEVESNDYLTYALLLRAEGKDIEADAYLSTFVKKQPNHTTAIAFKNKPNYLEELLDKPIEYRVTKHRLNTKFQEFGAYEHAGYLYFVSGRRGKGIEFGWAGQPALDIFVTEDIKRGRNAELLKGDVGTKYNEGAVAITKDGKTMYFTSNDRNDPKYKKGVTEVSELMVYKAEKLNDEWGNVKALGFNSPNYSVGNVALSPDEKKLYFVSDMPGGFGGTDLYVVNINEEGEFGEPQNLGENINTPGDENFPFIDSEGVLYFSSDGHLGMGGLDVFMAVPTENGFGTPQNLGQEVNSRSDDFSFVYYPEERRGYLSSNREGIPERSEIPVDNIYSVEKIIQEKIFEDLAIGVKLSDFETGRFIMNAKIDVQQNNVINTTKFTNDKGEVKIVLPGGEKHYTLLIEADNYESMAQEIKQEEGALELDIEMNPLEKMIGDEEIVLKPIHFQSGKWDITPQGAYELDKLVDIMRKHQNIKVHVIAHTDNIGSRDDNQRLSERRARATVMYVIEQGIRPYRIDGEGVGMSKPKIDCDKCTKEELAENRRSEFKIVEQ